MSCSRAATIISSGAPSCSANSAVCITCSSCETGSPPYDRRPLLSYQCTISSMIPILVLGIHQTNSLAKGCAACSAEQQGLLWLLIRTRQCFRTARHCEAMPSAQNHGEGDCSKKFPLRRSAVLEASRQLW